MSFQNRTITASEFAEQKSQYPEGGRWYELHAGTPKLLSSPDDHHGNIVMNLSRAIAQWLNAHRGVMTGYACHDLGLAVESNPDTVYVPAISYFHCGPLFSQTDLVVATQVPRLVIDVASSNDRRKDMRHRTTSFMKLGVESIWIPDPFKNEIQVLQRESHTLALGVRQKLEGGAVLPGFEMEVKSVFAQPEWWTSSKPRQPQ